MADDINEFVEVYISRETTQVSTSQFDVPLLLVNDAQADLTNRVQEFRSASAVAEVFGVGSAAHTMAVKLLSGDIRPAVFKVAVKGPQETYVEAVNAAMAYDNEWYALAIDSKLASDIKDVAALIQSVRRLFAASTADADVLTTVPANQDGTDVGSVLYAQNLTNTYLVYHQLAVTEFPEVVWLGSQLPEIPGSNTWAFKRATGVTTLNLSETQINALQSKRVNYVQRVSGVSMFQTGTTSGDSWIDETIFLHWLQARIQEQVFYRISTKKKIPMTQRGAAIIESEIRSVLAQGLANGGIADSPAFTVTSPDVLAIPEVTRAQRIMGDFLFTARLAGAVHRIRSIRGTVSA